MNDAQWEQYSRMIEKAVRLWADDERTAKALFRLAEAYGWLARERGLSLYEFHEPLLELALVEMAPSAVTLTDQNFITWLVYFLQGGTDYSLQEGPDYGTAWSRFPYMVKWVCGKAAG